MNDKSEMIKKQDKIHRRSKFSISHCVWVSRGGF